ncbi:MAG: GTPase [Solibacillus sp.]|uniref:GTPase n=1 Tax=Solibacillus sp. TaxID=1909654 RepID=UPI003314EDE6
MNIDLKNDLLNLPKLQLQVDTIVFDSIDSKPNWSKAYEQLDGLLQKVAQNFNSYIASNEGAMPKASTYWTLYMDIAAKILYFTGLAQSHLIDEQDPEARAQILERYQISVSCLPNASLEENEEFISEVKKSIGELTGKSSEIKLSEKTATCFEKFYGFTKSYE